MTKSKTTTRFENLDTSELSITFGPKVVQALDKLHDALIEEPRYRGDVEDMKSISGPNAVTVPVAFAFISNIVKDATEFAIKENKPEINDLVFELRSSLSGLSDDHAQPVTVSKMVRARGR